MCGGSPPPAIHRINTWAWFPQFLNELSCLLSQQDLVRPLQFTTEVVFHKDDVQQHFSGYVHSHFTLSLLLTGLLEQQLCRVTPPS